MDNIDFIIFQTLKENARISITRLAEIVNLSRPSVQYRLNKMVDEGIIEKFTIVTKPQNLGYNIVFYLKIYPTNPDNDQAVIQYLKEQNNIIEINSITGSANYLIKGAAVNMEDLNALVTAIKKYAKTETMILFDEIQENTSLEPLMQNF